MFSFRFLVHVLLFAFCFAIGGEMSPVKCGNWSCIFWKSKSGIRINRIIKDFICGLTDSLHVGPRKKNFLIWRINKHRLYMRKGLMLFFLHLYEIKIISSIFFLRKCCGVKVSKCCNNAHVFQNAPFILWKLLSAWNAALITSRCSRLSSNNCPYLYSSEGR